jgi:hypothetical protein
MDPETAIAIFGILAVIGLIALAMAFPLVGIIIASAGVALFVARYIYIRWIRDRRSPSESPGGDTSSGCDISRQSSVLQLFCSSTMATVHGD